jgi:hypothetical protein
MNCNAYGERLPAQLQVQTLIKRLVTLCLARSVIPGLCHVSHLNLLVVGSCVPTAFPLYIFNLHWHAALPPQSEPLGPWL